MGGKETTAKINKTKSWFFEKINRQTISQTHQEKKGEESNEPNLKWQWRNHNRQHRNTKDLRDYYQQLYDNKMDQLDLMDIYRTFHPKAINFTFFSSAHRTFSKIDHILSHKSSLGKFKKLEIMSSISSDHNAVRLDVNYRKKKTIKNTNIWRLNNMLLNNQ